MPSSLQDHFRRGPVARRSFLRVASALALLPWQARAQGAQGRPYTIIVPFPPGGGTDLIARAVARYLGEQLGATVVVDNRAGAGGLIGATALLQAPADGHTLFLSSNSVFSINPALRPSLPYDPQTAFGGLGLLGTAPLAILVKADSPWQSLADLIAAAKQRPGGYTYASFGPASVAHFAGELFKSQAGIDLLHVPYKGSAPAMQGLLGGQVDLAFDTVMATLPQLRAGTVRSLAVTSTARHENMPDVPTVGEAGVPDFNFSTWVGVVARADTPAAPMATLQQALRRALAMPELIQALEQQGLVVRGAEALHFDDLVRTEIPLYRTTAERANIRVEQ